MNRYDALRLILLATLVASLVVAAATAGLAGKEEGSGSANAIPGDGLDGLDASKQEGTGSANAVTDAIDGFLVSQAEGSGQAATGADGGFLTSEGDGSGSSPP